MWGTDMTATVTVQHGQVAVFVAVDHCSAECSRLHAALEGTRHEALEPVRQGVKARFGALGRTWPPGSASATITPASTWRTTSGARSAGSASRRPRPSSGHRRGTAAPSGSSGRCKENLLWVRTFETVEELCQALLAFRETYNEHWLIERHGHRSPARFRRNQLDSQPMAA